MLKRTIIILVIFLVIALFIDVFTILIAAASPGAIGLVVLFILRDKRII